jgi:WD40 repeat protein
MTKRTRSLIVSLSITCLVVAWLVRSYLVFEPLPIWPIQIYRPSSGERLARLLEDTEFKDPKFRKEWEAIWGPDAEPSGSRAARSTSSPAAKCTPSPAGEEPPLPSDLFRRMGSKERVYSVALSPNGKILASGGADGTIALWETATGKNTGTLKGHTRAVSSVAFHPDGKVLASGSFDTTIRQWEATTGKELHTWTSHRARVRCVTYSPDGRTLASGSDDRTLRLWEAATGKEIRSLAGAESAIESVAFSPDGKRLASVGGATIRLWDVGTGEEIRQWTRATLAAGDTPAAAHSLTLSPDGKLLAAGVGNFIRVWEVLTGKEVTTLTGHEGLVIIDSVAFSPDGKTLASGSEPSSFMDSGEKKCIRLWDMATGKQIAAWEGHPDGAHSVAFSPDGKLLASGGDQGVLLWKTPVAGQSRK